MLIYIDKLPGAFIVNNKIQILMASHKLNTVNNKINIPLKDTARKTEKKS